MKFLPQNFISKVKIYGQLVLDGWWWWWWSIVQICKKSTDYSLSSKDSDCNFDMYISLNKLH